MFGIVICFVYQKPKKKKKREREKDKIQLYLGADNYQKIYLTRIGG